MPRMTDLSADVIRKRAEADASLPIFVFRETSSTNILASEYARGNPEAELALFIADSQSEGRGRLGRSFVSREGVGLYFSLLVRRRIQARDALGLTTLAAVALCHALERLTPLKPKIKWVNDIYIGQRKLAGILTEGRLMADGSGKLEYAIIGIGVNVGRQDMSRIDQPATDIESECGMLLPRDVLAGELLREILLLINEGERERLLCEYRSRSLLDKRRVTVKRSNSERTATVLGISSDFSLHVRYDDGSEEFLNTGEVSTKLK